MPNYNQPLDALFALRKLLKKQISDLRSSTYSTDKLKESSLRILESTIHELVKIYKVFNIVLNLPDTVKKNLIENIVSNMKLEKKDQVDFTGYFKILQNTHLSQFNKAFKMQHYWEVCYLITKLCIDDNKSFSMKSQFNTVETEIYTLLSEHIITPQLDPLFLKIKNHFNNDSLKGKFGFKFNVSNHVEYKKLLELKNIAARVASRYDAYKETHLDAYHQFLDEVSPVLNQFGIYDNLIHVTMNAYIQNVSSKKDYPSVFCESFSLLKIIFRFFEKAQLTSKELERLVDKYDTVFNCNDVSKSKQNRNSKFKSVQKIESHVRNKSELANERTFESVVETTNENAITKYSKPIDHLPTNDRVTPIDDLPSNDNVALMIEAPIEKLSDKLSEKMEDLSIEDDEEQTVCTFDYKNYPKKKKSVSQAVNESHSENIEITNYGSKTEKTLQKIMDLSPKVKYSALTSLFVNKLSGYLNDKTGSSSRKLFAEKQTIFLHQRHGRDRKQYVDVNVVKDTRDLLQNLKIIPAVGAKRAARP